MVSGDEMLRRRRLPGGKLLPFYFFKLANYVYYMIHNYAQAHPHTKQERKTMSGEWVRFKSGVDVLQSKRGSNSFERREII